MHICRQYYQRGFTPEHLTAQSTIQTLLPIKANHTFTKPMLFPNANDP